jgi:hypothetical protein
LVLALSAVPLTLLLLTSLPAGAPSVGHRKRRPREPRAAHQLAAPAAGDADTHEFAQRAGRVPGGVGSPRAHDQRAHTGRRAGRVAAAAHTGALACFVLDLDFVLLV